MRHLTIYCFALCLLCCSTSLFSQEKKLPPKAPPVKNVFCAQELAMQRAFQQNPLLRTSHDEAEHSLYKFLQKQGMVKKLPPMYVLPVVVHIIHDNGAENITDATVLQGLQDLNDAYANIGYYDPATGVDTKIQFCLAKRDPNGNATTGITRNQSTLTDMTLENDDITVKDLNRWTPTEYINIWLVREICSSGLGCGVAGYAYFPSSHGMPEDGIMMEAEYFGSAQGASGVQIHEMGHYLGLYHTFQDGCSNGDCLADGDRVCDTAPDQSTAAVPCGFTANSCSTDADSGFPTDQNDLLEDYMDYGDFNCWSVFTQGQQERMHWFIEHIRPSLLDSKACLDPCTSALSASFSSSSTVLNVGGSVSFINTSTNSTSYEWKVDGVLFSTAINPSYTFNTVGSHEICLEVGNADPNCSDRFCMTITVNCPVVPSFSTNNFYPGPGESVVFTNASANATTYSWKVNGTTVGNAPNLDYAFPNAGTNTICLTAGNGLCANEFCLQVFVFAATGHSECEGSFIRVIGNANEAEEAHEILATPNGNLLVGGSKGSESLLMLVKPTGELLWERTFNFTNGNDFIRSMILDGDGMLVANGRDQINSATTNFTFRYDYQNNMMLWTRYMPDPTYTRLEGIMQKPGNGNYILYGLVDLPSTSLDNAFIEVDKLTGALIGMKTFDTGSTTDVYYNGTIYNGDCYLVGNQRYGGLDKIRPSLSKLDLAGNQAWTKIHLRSPNSTARLYAEDIFIQNDTTLILSRGNTASDAVAGFTAQLYSTDLSGDIIWAKNYAIAGGNTMSVRELIPLADGFIIQGYYVNAGGKQDLYFFRTDKLGNVIWAKSVGNPASDDISWSSLYNNGFIYFSAISDYNSGTNNILFGKMTLEGEIAGQGCDFVKDINVTVSNIANPYDGQHNLVQSTQTYPQNSATSNLADVNVPVIDLPSCACTEFSPSCDTSFLKTYGTPFQDERGNAIVEIPLSLGGGYLVGGGKGDSAMITRLDYNANIVWTRAFDATPDAADFIWALNFDSDNNVIGSGQTRDEPNFNVECFVFKYNIASNNIIWVNELDLNDPGVEIYRSIFEKSPGGNYIVAGDVDQNPQNALSDLNGMVLEINRNTGANVWQHNYTLGNAESFQKTLLHNGAIYTTGRYNFDATGTARMRPGITKFDLNGVQQWSKLYLKGVTSATTARLYASDMIVDNGLVVLGQGDNTGTTTTNVTPFLFKTDNDGDLLWAMNYDIPGATSEVSTQLLNLPDGYLCLGYYTASDQDVFLFKTDKQGQLQWSKSYGNTATEDAFDLVYSNGQIYFTGKTKAATAGASFDLYLANIGVDGTATALDSCNLFSDLNMTAAPYANPYDGQHNLTDLNQTWGQFLNDKAVTETAVQSTTVCFQPCLDSCDVVPNAFFQNATAACLGDSLLVSLTACNLGNFDLPVGTPVSFYLGNPTTTNAPLLGTFATPQALSKDSCSLFAFTIAAGPNTTIFAMLNDDGSTPRPFSITSFEADVMECDYSNNLGSFLLNFTAPTLNLGPDIVSCATGVNVLDAGSGFVSYHWQDGSIEQTLTAFPPGTYSVTVTDVCGGTQTDMLTITDDPASILDLGPDLLVCEGGSHTFDVPGYASYQWLPADFLSCTDCSTPTTTPTAEITYTLVATMADGCIGVDSVQVSVGPALETFANLTICQGDTATVFGMPVTSAGQFSQTFASQNGCDSVVTVSVDLLPALESFEDVMLCQGDTVFVFGMPVTAGGQFSQTLTSQNGCDSIVTVSVGMLPVLESFQDIVICQGDTTFVFGMPVTTTGQFSQTLTAQTGCDSIVTVSVGVLFPVSTQQNISICQGETVDIFGTPIGIAGTYSNIFTGYNGCDSTHTIVLTVNAVTIDFSTTNVTCMTLGSATAQASGGTGPYTYLWSNNETTATIDSLTAGSYTVTVTDANGCASTSTMNIQGAMGAIVNILVNSAVTEDEPSDGELTAIAIGGTAPYFFEWNNGETTADIDSLPSGTYTVTLTDANNCSSQATAFLFIPACTGGKIWNDIDRDGCQDAGETGIGGVQLMLSGTNIFGMSIADTTMTAINGEYIFNGLAPGNYFVKILVPAGISLSQPLACNDDTDDSDFSTSTFTSGVISLVEGHCCLTVDGGLFDACLNITTTGEICCDQTLCGPGNDPAPITSVAPALGGGGATQYMWMYSSVGGPMGPNWINIPTAMGPSYDPGPLSQTTYFVRCAKSATCTTWLESNVVVIAIGNAAVADILPPGPVCTNDPVTFTAAPNQVGASYTWNFGPWATPSTSTLPNPTVGFSQAGVTTITLTVVRNGCTSTDVLDITVSNNPTYCSNSITLPGGGQSALADGQFTIFPNPFSDGLTVSWSEGIESQVSIRVYSVEGRLLHSGHSDGGAMHYEAKLSSLPPGVYLLRLRSEAGQTGVFKLVKE